MAKGKSEQYVISASGKTTEAVENDIKSQESQLVQKLGRTNQGGLVERGTVYFAHYIVRNSSSEVTVKSKKGWSILPDFAKEMFGPISSVYFANLFTMNRTYELTSEQAKAVKD